jgi:hypothetical protein
VDAEPLQAADGHSGCRLGQFARWPRVVLEHERAYLSRAVSSRAAFLTAGSKAGIMHDLSDIDRCLAGLDEPMRVVPQ